MFEAFLERLEGQPGVWIRRGQSTPGLRAAAWSCPPGAAPAEALAAGQYEWVLCREGMLELGLQSGQTLTLNAGELLLLSDAARPQRLRFSGAFSGVLVCVGDAAGQSLRQLAALLGAPELEPREAAAALQHCGGCGVIRRCSWSAALLESLRTLPEDALGSYCTLKTAELCYLLGREQLPLGGAAPEWDAYLLERVEQVHGYLHEHLAEPLTIEQLARQFHLSATSLKRCFRQVYGRPLHQQLLHYRLEQAALLLRTTRRPVALVAEEIGYHSASQFGAAFKRHYGVTPLVYRNRARKKD